MSYEIDLAPYGKYNYGMPSDVITLSALCKELDSGLSGGKIEKIYQPENDELTFTIKKGGIRTLLISANANLPRIHITEQKKENPFSASSFCMLMRKYAGGGIIQNISLLAWDRIIKIELISRNEMGDKTPYFILAELMGRYSNIILTDSNFTIIDAIKRINIDQNAERPILPKLKYTVPRQNRITLGDTAALTELFSTQQDVDEKFLLENISGISKDTAKELIARGEKLSGLQNFLEINSSADYKPCLRFDQNGKAADFHITPYKSQSGDYTFFSSLNDAIERYYLDRATEQQKKFNTKELVKLLTRLQTKTERRIAEHQKKLEECDRSDTLRIYGELILSNLHKLKKGDKTLVCLNFYDNAEVTIPLNELLPPNKNAQAYFKRYTKLKRAKEISLQQLDMLYVQRQYLQTFASAIKTSDTKQEYQEILEELRAVDGRKVQNPKKQKKSAPSAPLHIIFEGADIYVGKNNIQNNAVTFSIASSNDLWLHAKDYHGAHTIIKGNVTDRILQRAAEICAYFSETKDSPKAEIDYTLRKNVKRHKSGVPGLVTYTDFKTVVVQPKFN